jgi:hypothetical protein
LNWNVQLVRRVSGITLAHRKKSEYAIKAEIEDAGGLETQEKIS